MSAINNPHDKLFRASLQNKDVAKAFFERYLPKPIYSTLDTSTLTLNSNSYIDEQLKETLSDLVFNCRYRNKKGDANIILLVEHQSTPQRLMPFRVYHYMFNMLHRQLLEHLNSKQSVTKLPAVYALVFYHGEQTPYPFSMHLSDCFDDPYNIMNNLFLGEVPLVDVNEESDEELKSMKLLGIMALLLKYCRSKDCSQYLPILIEQLNSLDFIGPATLNSLDRFIHYLLTVGSVEDVAYLIEQSHQLVEPVRGEIMTIAEQLEARGAEKAEKQTREEVAIASLKEGIAPQTVAKISQLDLAFILKLKTRIDKDSQ